MEDSIKRKIEYINSYKEPINIMEVCGTHTRAISKFGIRSILSPNINLISGPGCPVCVTDSYYIDYAYKLALDTKNIIATYGDMMRVPGSNPSISLEKAKAFGGEVKMVYSSMDAVEIAIKNSNKRVIFLGIGFETTAPATAIAIKEAKKRDINNFYVLSMHKIMEPIMKTLLEDKESKIDGFLCPGHVATIIGEKGFRFIEDYNCAGVIAGFELQEIIEALYYSIKSLKEKRYNIVNCYKSLVSYEGNNLAKSIMEEVFEIEGDYWRGIGKVENSGLKLREEFKSFNIEAIYPMENNDLPRKINKGCSCGEVIKGTLKPKECKLFKSVCNPSNPVGPCMVSSEGSCAAYFKYNFI